MATNQTICFTPKLADGRRRQITVRKNPRTLAFDAEVTVAAPKNYSWAKDWARRKGLSQDDAEEFARGLERADSRKRLNGASDSGDPQRDPTNFRSTAIYPATMDPIKLLVIEMKAYVSRHCNEPVRGVLDSKLDDLLNADEASIRKSLGYGAAEDGGTQLQTITVGDSASRLSAMFRQPNTTNASIKRLDAILRPRTESEIAVEKLSGHIKKIGTV